MAMLASAAVATLVLVACEATDDNGDGDGDGTGDENGQELAGEQITIGVFTGWDEGIVASYLLGIVFADAGATVEYLPAGPGPTFDGVAAGDADVSFDAWLPNTHADFWAQHEGTIEDLGVWYDEAPLTIAVNEDSPVQSLADLADSADEYGNRIVGIEPGSGLNRITREEVIPTYGLEGMDFVESDSSSMLTELETAIDAGENIVVTLWQPHWAYAAFPIRNLEDPEGVLAEAEQIHAFGRPGFTEDLPVAAEWVGNFTLDEEQLLELERIMVVEDQSASDEEYTASMQKWLDANPDWVDQLKAGELG
jgi:glycine betaine/proline transport system substrate-binding protein